MRSFLGIYTIWIKMGKSTSHLLQTQPYHCLTYLILLKFPIPFTTYYVIGWLFGTEKYVYFAKSVCALEKQGKLRRIQN